MTNRCRAFNKVTQIMKKASFVMIILAISNLIIAQESKLSLGLVGSVDIQKNNYETPTGAQKNYEFNSLIGFSAGMRAQYMLSDKFFLRSGLLYAQRGYQVDYNFIFRDLGDPAIPRTSYIKSYFLTVPILIGYGALDGEKFKIIPAAGINVGFGINETETTIYEDDSKRKSDLPEFMQSELNKSQVSIQLNLSVEYHLTEKLFVSIEPYINYGFSGLNDNIEKGNPMTYGGILGVNYKYCKRSNILEQNLN